MAFADAFTAMHATIRNLTGVSVTYVRVDGTRTALSATVGNSDFEANTDAGGVLQMQTRDYLISVAALPGGVPVKGDKIEEVAGGVTYVYELVEPGGSACWRWADSVSRAAYRIHTMLADE